MNEILKLQETEVSKVSVLTLYALMDSSFSFDMMNLEWSIVHIEGTQVIIFKENCIFLKMVFVLATSVDPDEMPHYGAFHLGLHCLPNYAFRSHLYIKD